MSSQSYCFNRYERNDARGPKSRTTTKPKSLMKKLKSLLCFSSAAMAEEAEISSYESSRRRTEALHATGLLPQSRIYGHQPYRDDAYTVPSAAPPRPEKETETPFNIADEKDLITFDEGVSDAAHRSTTVSRAVPLQSYLSIPPRDEVNEAELSCSPTPPLSPNSPPSPLTPLEGDFEAPPLLTLDNDASRPYHADEMNTPGVVHMRRMGSLKKDTDAIEDEESRRLTEIAFLC